MNVAVPWCQHSPMFGQWASSHTVFSSQLAHDALEPQVVRRPGRTDLQPRGLRLAWADELDRGAYGHLYKSIEGGGIRRSRPARQPTMSPLTARVADPWVSFYLITHCDYLVRPLHVSPSHAWRNAPAVRSVVTGNPSCPPSHKRLSEVDLVLCPTVTSITSATRDGPARPRSSRGCGVRAVRLAGPQGNPARSRDEQGRLAEIEGLRIAMTDARHSSRFENGQMVYGASRPATSSPSKTAPRCTCGRHLSLRRHASHRRDLRPGLPSYRSGAGSRWIRSRRRGRAALLGVRQVVPMHWGRSRC